MNVVWIIGNGFDLNLGLKTGYGHFYDRCYSMLSDEEAVAQRGMLDSIAGKLGAGGGAWSDLEAFLGASTCEFRSVDEHYACFQRMKVEMEKYIEEQQGRFDPSAQSPEFLVELNDSLTGFEPRLDQSDRDALRDGIGDGDFDRIDVVTLNYTNCLDVSIAEFGKRPDVQGGSGALDLKQGEVIHAHGSLEPPRQIVFATGGGDMVANHLFRRDDEFRQCWTKTGLDAVYGNGMIDRALGAIAQADLVATFGCSFGGTDQHLWSAVGDRLRKSPGACVVCFDRQIPEKHPDTLAYVRGSRKARGRLASRFSTPGLANDSKRILPVPSTRVFSFAGPSAPALSPDPYGETEKARRQSRQEGPRALGFAGPGPQAGAGAAAHAGSVVHAGLDAAKQAEILAAKQAELYAAESAL